MAGYPAPGKPCTETSRFNSWKQLSNTVAKAKEEV